MSPGPRAHAPAAEALAVVAPLATRWIERLLAQHDPPLTVVQYLALRAIGREGVSGSDLARRSGVSGPAVSQLVAGLADAGLVEREPVDADRRRIALTLSGGGQRVLASAGERLRKGLGALLVDLPGPEADALARALPKVEAALSGSQPPRRRPHPPRPPRPPRPRRSSR